MANATTKASMLIVTAPHRLTKEQRAEVAARVEPNLPADVGLVILDGGLTAQVVGATPRRWSSKRRPFNGSAKVTQ